jgi:hypothetical protein
MYVSLALPFPHMPSNLVGPHPSLQNQSRSEIVNSVAFSSDGRHLAVGYQRSCTAMIWDMFTRKQSAIMKVMEERLLLLDLYMACAWGVGDPQRGGRDDAIQQGGS